nr:hypothetical protein [uncultured Holophaga sp.]
MIPKRYLIATLFIAAMLLILAVVRGPEDARTGGHSATPVAMPLGLDSFEKLAEYRIPDGWAPRFVGAQDPDQWTPWPLGGGFEVPWEPASAYLEDQGLALNGPDGKSEIVLWKGLEWRHYRFDAPLASARLDPDKGTRLLVTLSLGKGRFRSQLMEVPEGRVVWSVESGPWSRFSWDGEGVLVGLFRNDGPLLLASLPLDGDPGDATLAPWDEKGLSAPPRGLPTKEDQLWDEGRDLPGSRLATPWGPDAHLWFPRKDWLWIGQGDHWTAWHLEDRVWHRKASGEGNLTAFPPLAMGRSLKVRNGILTRQTTKPDREDWKDVPEGTPAWPLPDAAWSWPSLETGLTAWDQRWGASAEAIPRERQREALSKAYRSDWRTSVRLRASVRGWLVDGPEIALREAKGSAWIWTGDRVILVRLPPSERLAWMRKHGPWK